MPAVAPIRSTDAPSQVRTTTTTSPSLRSNRPAISVSSHPRKPFPPPERCLPPHRPSPLATPHYPQRLSAMPRSQSSPDFRHSPAFPIRLLRVPTLFSATAL